MKYSSKTPEPRHDGRVTRRRFLGTAAGVAAAPWIIPASAMGADGHVAPSNRINIGQIGRGRMGLGHLRRLAYDPNVQVMALCEVDKTRLEDGRLEVQDAYEERAASGEYKGLSTYNEYRELLARDDIDAVVIVTPDHWHSLQSIHAAKAGKDIYCEKPVSVTVEESRRLVQAVQRYGRVFQNGSQYRSATAIRRVCEFVRGGGLGKVKSAYTIWGGMSAYSGSGPYHASVTLDVALAAEPTPEWLDWDLWVGPAQIRPYNQAYHRNPIPGVVPWSFCEDFGAGACTGYHSHAADVMQYALGYEESGPVDIIHPYSGEFPTVTYRYDNGTLFHMVDGWQAVKSVYHAVPDDARLEGNFGGVFVGERGWLTSMTGGGDLEGGPASIFEELGLPSRSTTQGKNDHYPNWLECIKTREKPHSHEEIGHRAASLGHLTHICLHLGRSLKWDPAKEEFVGDDQANRMLRRASRAPWNITA